MTFDEVEQGASDTCAFTAALSAVALSDFDLASGISVANRKSPTDIVYNVRLFDPTPGHGLSRADRQVEFIGIFQPDDVRSTDSDEFWATLYYRAYRDLETSPGLDYHRSSEALEALTGAATSWTSIGDITPALLKSWLDSGSPVVASSADVADDYALDPAEGIIGDHAYTVLGIEGSGAGTYVTLRNPWASDSTNAYAETIDGVDDGIVRIPYASFVRYFDGAARSLITGPSINSPQAPPPTFTTRQPGLITIRQGQSVDLDFSAVDSRGRPVHYDLYGGGGFDAFLGWSTGHFHFLAGSSDVWTHTWTVKASSDPLSAASQTFSVQVLANQPSVGGVAASPSSINASGSDRLTLQASGLTIPAGVVDSVAFYLGHARLGLHQPEGGRHRHRRDGLGVERLRRRPRAGYLHRVCAGPRLVE